ncbi:ABC transporter ATP-binding protein [Lactobacillus sp. ESL0684]|uniref:ATP-binding cassette domain-containing protein n=1 Tax=Lactobacillus sp. ESL0684 TaxID=2983213 RepID=UPI0023F94CD8|nr:ABC transporter ATP-binding protein [Lactobacillus sp. ESL0684]WEV44110.1 ABC transporter ATP-binding protein [Lactobacillus sp. ESL0684]
MFKYLKQHFLLVALVSILLLSNSFLQVYAATQMAQLANFLIARKFTAFMTTLAFIFGIWLITFVLTFIEGYLQELVTQQIVTSIRTDLVDSLSHLSTLEFQQKSVDYYESWLQNDVNLIRQQGINSLFVIIRFSGNAIFALGALLNYSYLLFSIALILLILIIAVPKLVKPFLTKGASEISAANEKFLQVTSSALHGYETLSAFNALKELVHLTKVGSQFVKRANVHNACRQGEVGLVTGMINIGSQLVVLGVTGYLHFQGVVSAGAILATAELATKVFDSAGIINNNFAKMMSVTELFAKFKQIDAQTDNNEQQISLPNDQFESLEFRNVSFSYPNTKTDIIDNFSYKFTAGETYQLTGVSGRGKTTLFRLATKQLLPQSGQILLNGIDLCQLSREQINRIIVAVPQNITIFPESLDYNVTLGRELKTQALAKTKQTFGVNDNWQVESLSGGERQRLALARLVAVKDKLVLLDESFSSVDLPTSKVLLEAVLKQTDSVILISHRQAEVAGLKLHTVSLD